MTIFGVHLRPPDEEQLRALLEVAQQSTLTYSHVGSTLGTGPRRSERRRSLVVGQGARAFDRAVDALRQWRPQHHLGARVVPGDAPIEVGSALLVVLPFGPGTVVAPVRVVAVVVESGRFGFAYGTLPGHPERGEESFLIERSADDQVGATIRVDARPATLPARLAGPMVMAIQRRALTRYLQGIEQHVQQWS